MFYTMDESMSPISLNIQSKETSRGTCSPKRKIIRLEARRSLPTAAANNPEQCQWNEKREVSSSAESSDSPRVIQNIKRKETARRQLLGSIYTKHKPVGRSFTFVAGERPRVQIRLPRVCYKEKTEKNISGAQISSKPKLLQNKNRYSKIPDNTTTSAVSDVNGKPVHRTNSQKLSLPDIIMDFNIEASMAANDKTLDTVIQDTESENEERALGAPYEEYLKPRISLNNPYGAKHRPVTPGLLDSLNKLKLPSKVKTEQWLKSSQNLQKSYCGGSYKIGNLHSSNLAYPNWIYTDT